MVRALIVDPRVNVNQADTDEATPLFFAGGNVEVVKALLAHQQINIYVYGIQNGSYGSGKGATCTSTDQCDITRIPGSPQ